MDWRRLVGGKKARHLLWMKPLLLLRGGHKRSSFSLFLLFIAFLTKTPTSLAEEDTTPAYYNTTTTISPSITTSSTLPGDEWTVFRACKPFRGEFSRIPSEENYWPPNPPGKTIKLGFLMTMTRDRDSIIYFPEQLGLKIAGMITYGVETVNNASILPQNYTLQFDIRDTQGDLVLSTKHVTDLVCKGISAFIGPESSCWVEANIAEARNLPMISYACYDEKGTNTKTFADLQTFSRTNPSEIHILRATIATLKHFKWAHFSILYQSSAPSMSETLQRLAKENNFTLNHVISFNAVSELYDHFWNSKDHTRIYVLLGHRSIVPHALRIMVFLGLLQRSKRQYLLIFVEKEEFQQKEWDEYIFDPITRQRITEENECLKYDLEEYGNGFMIVANTLPKNISFIEGIVREYNSKSPFCLNADITDQYNKHVPFLPSSNLYDAVVQYAKVVRWIYDERVQKQNGSTEGIDVEEIARDGVAIGEKFKNYTFTSLLGYDMTIGSNRESEGSYSVYYYQESDECKLQQHNSSLPCNTHCLMHISDYRNNALHTNFSIPIVDIPKCGYDNKCDGDPLDYRKIILFALIFALLILVFLSIQKYRHWRYKQEILGLQWRIDKADLIPRNRAINASTMSIMSNTSQEFNTQVFYSDMADHKGTIVCRKNIEIEQELTEKSMKQMRSMREIKHPNICPFIGACEMDQMITLVTEYCSRGSLEDILENDDITLDNNFVSSLVQDLLRGMCFLHSLGRPHGNLKSTNCVVTGRWILQITDYDLYELRYDCIKKLDPEVLYENNGRGRFLKSQLWRPPELLGAGEDYLEAALVPGTKEGDVYAFGVILHEIIARKGPFSTSYGFSSSYKSILDEVKRGKTNTGLLRRPNLNDICDKPFGSDIDIRNAMTAAWAENKENRPEFKALRAKLKIMKKSGNLMDNIVTLLEEHNKNLEGLVTQRTILLREEKKITEDLLHRMLPRTVASNLLKKLPVAPQDYDYVTIYFSDIVGFTTLSADSDAYDVVAFLNDLYSDFDATISGYDVYKVETIGDAYMVASGLPEKNEGRHAGEIASMALELLEKAKTFKIHHKPDQILKVRIGLHTGPVIAGVVGRTMPRYCLFGDTVNTASRMESNGEPHRIHISKQCMEALEELGGYIVEERGFVEMKGKGTVFTYWLTGADENAITRKEKNDAPMRPFFQRYDEFDMNVRPRSPRETRHTPPYGTPTPSINSRSIGDEEPCVSCGRETIRGSPRDERFSYPAYHARRLSSAIKANSIECSTRGGLLSPPRKSDTAASSVKTASSGSSVRESHSLDKLPQVQLAIPALRNLRKEISPSSSEPSLPIDSSPKVNFSCSPKYRRDTDDDGDTDVEMENHPMLLDDFETGSLRSVRARTDSITSAIRAMPVKNFVQNLLGRGKKDALNASKSTINGIPKESHV